MKQQINLFQPIFRKEKKLLSFVFMLYTCGMVSLTLLLISAYAWRQSVVIDAELARLNIQLIQRKHQLEEMTTQVARIKIGGGAQDILGHLDSELKARREVVGVLENIQQSYTKGVSNYLEGFSRQTPKGVWLSSFLVQGGGAGLEIRGSSLKADLVPEFLQQLSKEETLAGTQFGLLQIARDDLAQGQVNFIVYTGAEPPDLKP